MLIPDLCTRYQDELQKPVTLKDSASVFLCISSLPRRIV